MTTTRMNVILFAAGSYNPPTHMHLRMFEIARDFLHQSGGFKVLGGIISPVHDQYQKESLSEANASHRNAMVKLCVSRNPFIKLSTYETEQSSWTRLRIVLEEHMRLLLASVETKTLPCAPDHFDPKEAFRILFLCGADLLESFSVPGLWAEEDIEVIVKDFGLVVISREGSNPQKYIYNSDMLTKYKSNIHIVTEWITNDISSTKVRRSLRRKESVKYLIPDEVIQYISEHGLYGTRKTEYSSPIDSSPLINSASACLHRPEEVSTFSACLNSQSEEVIEQLHESNYTTKVVDFFYSNDEIKDSNSTPTSCTSSVQSQLSLIKSSSSPVLEELQDEAITPSEDEMSPLEKEFNASDLTPIQESLPLIVESDERSFEDESSLAKEAIPLDTSSYYSEALQEALILDEKKAVVEETESWIEEVVEENTNFHVIEEKFVQVREAFVEEVLHDGEGLENSLPVIEECPRLPTSPDATDSLSTEELDKTVIENSERSLVSKDSVDFSDMPPPPLPYTETPSESMDSIHKTPGLDDHNVILDQQKEELEHPQKDLPPDPPLPIKTNKKATPSKKSEDKVQIEITKKGIIVISEKESFL